MGKLDMVVVTQLELQGNSDAGYVGEYKGALIHLNRLGSKQVYLALTVRGNVEDIPVPPEPLKSLLDSGQMTVQKAHFAVRATLEKPDSVDADGFLTGLKGWIEVFRQAGLLPETKCYGCLERRHLSVMARDGRAVHTCADCQRRAQYEGGGKSTAMASVADTMERKLNAKTGGRAVAVTTQFLVGVAFLPVATVMGALVWIGLWYCWFGFTGMLVKNNVNPPGGIVTFVVGCMVACLAAVPIAINVRLAKVTVFMPRWIPAIVFGLMMFFLGEVVLMLLRVYSDTGEWHPEQALRLFSYYLSMGKLALVARCVFAFIIAYFIAIFAEETPTSITARAPLAPQG